MLLCGQCHRLARQTIAPTASRRVAPQATQAVRAYTDYQHREYPRLWIAYFGIIGGTLACWFQLFAANSNLWECHRERHRATFQRMHQRISSQSTGYTWSTDFGPEIKSAFVNLPSSAE